jgi:hypothetical protein
MRRHEGLDRCRGGATPTSGSTNALLSLRRGTTNLRIVKTVRDQPT